MFSQTDLQIPYIINAYSYNKIIHLLLRVDTHSSLSSHLWSWWFGHFDHEQVFRTKGVWQQLPHCHLLAQTVGLGQVHVPVWTELKPCSMIKKKKSRGKYKGQIGLKITTCCNRFASACCENKVSSLRSFGGYLETPVRLVVLRISDFQQIIRSLVSLAFTIQNITFKNPVMVSSLTRSTTKASVTYI